MSGARRPHDAVQASHQELVLDVDLQAMAGVLAGALDAGEAAHEASLDAPLDVRHLATQQARRARRPR